MVRVPIWEESLVDLLGQRTPGSLGHHLDLHGPADYSSHREQKGAQAEGRPDFFFLPVWYLCLG